MIGVHVTGIVRDEGTVMVLAGEELDESLDVVGAVTFAADYRCAQAIILDMIVEDVVADVEEWQLLTRTPAFAR